LADLRFLRVVVGEKGNKISQPLTFRIGPGCRDKCVGEIGGIFVLMT
jgi:hypothetical protein